MVSKIQQIYPHLKELDGYGLAVAEWIHQVYPQWTSDMSAKTYDEQTFLSVTVAAPCPHPLSHGDLLISTEDDDLTVHFDGYHTHFGRFYQTAKEAFPSTKAFIDDIIQERLVVLVGLVGFGACYAPESVEEQRQVWKQRGQSAAYARSWKGTYNRVYDVD